MGGGVPLAVGKVTAGLDPSGGALGRVVADEIVLMNDQVGRWFWDRSGFRGKDGEGSDAVSRGVKQSPGEDGFAVTGATSASFSRFAENDKPAGKRGNDLCDASGVCRNKMDLGLFYCLFPTKGSSERGEEHQSGGRECLSVRGCVADQDGSPRFLGMAARA